MDSNVRKLYLQLFMDLLDNRRAEKIFIHVENIINQELKLYV